jgi:hypothetical protein
METQGGEAAAPLPARRRHGFFWGLTAGLVPNAVIFGVLFSTSWVDQHVDDWLALGVLYAGPVIVALAGLMQVLSKRTRKCGIGLILAGPTTVALWFLIVYIDTLVSLSANTPGP